MRHHLTPAEIHMIAEEIVKEQGRHVERPVHWFHDVRKRHRVIFVSGVLVIALVLEVQMQMKWSHRIFEIATDCLSDFILFGSIE